MRFGTDEQKSYFLPGILAGDINFAIGYTEPEAGTDLASLRTRAVRDGDEYVVNGAKIFTSGADMADYVWLAVRTDPDAPKHKGISILCVPHRFARLLLEPHRHRGRRQDHRHLLRRRARARLEHRVGAENEGWRMITTQLNHERVGLAAWSGFASAPLRGGHRLGGRAPCTADGRGVLDLPWVQSDLARCRAELEAMYLLNWRMATPLAGRAPEPGRLLGGEGVRCGAQHRHLPPAARHRGGRRLPGSRARRARRWPAASSAPPATPRSTPSAAGSTRSNARSWPWPAWA